MKNKNIIFGILQGKDNEKTINEDNFIYSPYAYNMNISYFCPQFMMNGLNYVQMINKNNLL